MTDSATLSAYGRSGPALEALRRAVAARCPQVSFGGHTPSGARIGEYSFRPVAGRSAWIQAPLTPTGRLRKGGGRWRFRLTTRHGSPDTWQHAVEVDPVVDWLCAQVKS